MTEDTTNRRYFITDESGVERETDANDYIALERRCGFRPKAGCGPFATASFSHSKGGAPTLSGRIEHDSRIRQPDPTDS